MYKNKSDFFNNELVINVKKEQEARKSKLHIFCLVDNSEKIVEQLKNVVKELNIDKNRIIYFNTKSKVQIFDISYYVVKNMLYF